MSSDTPRSVSLILSSLDVSSLRNAVCSSLAFSRARNGLHSSSPTSVRMFPAVFSLSNLFTSPVCYSIQHRIQRPLDTLQPLQHFRLKRLA